MKNMTFAEKMDYIVDNLKPIKILISRAMSWSLHRPLKEHWDCFYTKKGFVMATQIDFIETGHYGDYRGVPIYIMGSFEPNQMLIESDLPEMFNHADSPFPLAVRYVNLKRKNEFGPFNTYQ